MKNVGDNNTIMPVDEKLINPSDKFIFKVDYFYQSPPPSCAKDTPPCPYMPIRLSYKAGQSIGEEMVKAKSIPMGVLSLNPAAVASKGTDNQQKAESKDPWTGGIEWDRVFSITNFWRIVVFVFFLFLFLKYVLPLIKQSLKKA